MSRTLIAMLMLCASAWIGGCTLDAGAESVEPPDELAVVTEGTFSERLLLTGEIDAAVAQFVSVPRLPSWQTSVKWLAEEGSRVRKGEKVAELDTASFASDLDSKIEAEAEATEKLRQQIEETSADLSDKEFQYLSRKADYETARMNAEIPPDIVSQKEYEERQLAFERARTELEKAETLLESTRRTRAADRENLELDLAEKRRQIAVAERAIATMTLYAPEDGVLVLNEHPWFGRKLEAGDNVWVGFQIARIPDLSTLQVKADLYDVDDGRVRPGMPATVVIDAFPAKVFQGEVSRVSAVAEEEGGRSLRRIFEVLIDIDGVDADVLRPGLSARATIEMRTIENATMVRRGSIDFSGETPIVVLADGSSAELSLIACNPQVCAVESLDPEIARKVASR